MEQIEIEYSLNEETLRKAYKVVMAHRGTEISYPVLLAVWLIITFIQFVWYQDYTLSALFFNLSFLLFIGLILYYFRVYNPNKWIKDLSRDRDLSHPVTLTFKPTEILSTGKFASSTMSWAAFKKMLFTEDVIIAYLVSAGVVSIPVSAFTPEQLNQLKIWARANVKEVIE